MSSQRSDAPEPESRPPQPSSPLPGSSTNVLPDGFFEGLFSVEELAQLPSWGPANPLTGSFYNALPDSFFDFNALFSAGELAQPPSLGPATPLASSSRSPQAVSDRIVPDIKNLSLRTLPVANTRVVVSPRDDPGNNDLEHMTVSFQLNNSPGQLYACIQSADNALFSFFFRQKRYALYFDPKSDNIVLRNYSTSAIQATSLRDDRHKGVVRGHDSTFFYVQANASCELNPGPWRLTYHSTTGDREMAVDLFIFHRRYLAKKGEGADETAASGGKRKGLEAESIQPSKRGRGERGQAVVLISTPSDGAIDTSLQPVKEGNALLNLESGQKVEIASSQDLAQGRSEESTPQTLDHDHNTYTLVHERDLATDRSSASVFSADHQKFGIVAVKVLRNKKEPQYLGIPELASDWENERGVLRRIKHESIVGFYGADARFHSIYMEYIPFPSLSNSPWKKRDWFTGTDADAKRVVRDMSSALVYLHKNSILHNDIKPSNILYDRRGGAVLIDFGSATYKATTPCSGGTPWYVPREYLRGERGCPSDMFALGVTALYLLRMVPLPDTTQPYWKLSMAQSDSSAKEAMQAWLATVREQQDELADDILIEDVIKCMLNEVRFRITAVEAFERLRTEDKGNA
ncbi:kinase-like domain-containing protein [Xylariomycetidae sp. FL2044]|nr:kinase-like domain-containing protein [Xylariomycetidae sp. FL2044]